MKAWKLTSSFFFLSSVPTEKWKQDRDLSGARNNEEEEAPEASEASEGSFDEDLFEEESEEDINLSDHESDKEEEEDIKMPAKKTPAKVAKAQGGASKTPPRAAGKSKTPPRSAGKAKAAAADDITDGMKGLTVKSFWSREVINGYTVGTVLWAVPGTRQGYLDIRVHVPLSTKVANLHPAPALVSNKTVMVWIRKHPRAAEFDPVFFPGVLYDQHRDDVQDDDFTSKVQRYDDASQEYKASVGTGDVDVINIPLSEKCDMKGFWEPISGAVGVHLLTTQVPIPDDPDKTYPVRLLILSLELAKKPIVDVEVAEVNSAKNSLAKTYIQMRKVKKNLGVAKASGLRGQVPFCEDGEEAMDEDMDEVDEEKVEDSEFGYVPDDTKSWAAMICRCSINRLWDAFYTNILDAFSVVFYKWI